MQFLSGKIYLTMLGQIGFSSSFMHQLQEIMFQLH